MPLRRPRGQPRVALKARARWSGLCLAAIFFLAGCASTPQEGTLHVLKPGENLYRLSIYYGVPVDRIVRANRVRDEKKLRVGTRLFVPGTRRKAPRESLAGAPHVASGGREHLPSNLRFLWPLKGRLSSGFGWRGTRPHEGIDIAARKGTDIRASAPGRVILAGWLGGYGRVVIVKHTGPYSTVYAHTSRNRVKKGQFVEAGQVIAEVGTTGNAKGAHLHFEIRRERKARDPLRYLPRSASR